jgi:UDP-2,3-diacylglucosamine pyrophosphatase LpxH
MTTETAQRNLLIVSDLHLSEGCHLRTGKYSPNEDFFFDEQFARFLAHYQNFPTPGRWHLIINGDFLDLLQVVSLDGTPPGLSRDAQHPEYGAGCGEQETIFKLNKIAEGHPHFFQALAGFVAAGNMLTIIKGNHDVEFHYPGVRAALVDALRTACPKARAGHPVSGINDKSVLFSDWFYHEKGQLWVEHGNQYDSLNTFSYGLCPLLPELGCSSQGRPDKSWPEARKDEIDLPWGSLFVRYLFNKIEGVEPFADNIKPQTKFLMWLVRKHPITAFRFTCKDGGYMLGKIRRAWAPLPKDAYKKRREQHENCMQDLAREKGVSLQDLHDVDGLRARSVLKEPTGFFWRAARRLVRYQLMLPVIYVAIALLTVAVLLAISPVLAVLLPEPIRKLVMDSWIFTNIGQAVLSVSRWLAVLPLIAVAVGFVYWLFTPEESRHPGFLKAVAGKIADLLKVQYVVMGHTHDPDLQNLGGGREYFNTGTWTRVFSEEERLLREDVEFTFLEGVRKDGRLRLKLMKWDDNALEPRLLPLLEDDELPQASQPEPRRKSAGKAA